MYAKQRLTLEAFGRVQVFLAANPAPPPATYAGPKEQLDEAVRALREYAGAQEAGLDMSKGEMRLIRELAKRLVDRHIRPIVTIAQAQTVEPDSDVRIPEALRTLPAGNGFTKLVTTAKAVAEKAKAFESVFLTGGLPADFLAQLDAARQELEEAIGKRAAQIGVHVGAKAGLFVQQRRARRAVVRLDSIVRIAFEKDEPVLEKWRQAKRVHALRVVSISPAPMPTAA